MKKHIFVIFTFFATFFSSLLLIGFLTETAKSEEDVSFPSGDVVYSLKTTFETEQQTRIRKFLEKDRSFVDNHSVGYEEEKKATERIVKDMRNLAKDSALPIEIRIAYQNNIKAWSDYSRHENSLEYHSFTEKECLRLSKNINITYQNLLNTAKEFGVDFKP